MGKIAIRKRIFIKGVYDLQGGVEDVIVTKTETYNEAGTEMNNEVIFEGDISDLSKDDNEDEIRTSLKNRFEMEGYEVVFSIK